MKRFSQALVVALAALFVSVPAQAVGKAKATPTPWPSEMPNFAADRIKFAKGRGLGPEAERHLVSVRGLVPALEAKLKPPAALEEDGKAA